jgi:hypothetical protein
MMKRFLRSVGRFLRAVIAEGNPGVGSAGTDRAREETYRNNSDTYNW